MNIGQDTELFLIEYLVIVETNAAKLQYLGQGEMSSSNLDTHAWYNG